MTATATLLVCDDLRMEVTNKMLIVGGYTGDITINAEPFSVNTLHFMFQIDVPVADNPRTIVAEVTLPNDEPRQSSAELAPNLVVPEGRKRWVFRQLVTFYRHNLRPGKISARVIVNDQEIDVPAPWIVLQPDITPDPNASPPPS